MNAARVSKFIENLKLNKTLESPIFESLEKKCMIML